MVQDEAEKHLGDACCNQYYEKDQPCVAYDRIDFIGNIFPFLHIHDFSPPSSLYQRHQPVKPVPADIAFHFVVAGLRRCAERAAVHFIRRNDRHALGA